jgi:Protein of unknown function DUF262
MNSNTEKPDLDFDEEEDVALDMIRTPFDPANVDIFDRKLTISSLLERLKHRELRLTPDFQRRANLWDAPRKSRLIESVLLRIPLPSFYFSEDSDGNFEVVDGLQRLCSIFHFVDHAALNKATGSKLDPLRLQGLQYLIEKEEKSFDELERSFQRRINELEINVNVIRATTPKAVMFNVFARLNQGGLPLAAQEIRNAIFPGAWRERIRTLAEGEDFLRATESRVPTDRQQDMEMVLRFVSLWALGAPFLRQTSQVLDKFLNDSVEVRLSSWDATKWEAAKEAFTGGLGATLAIFGRHAFRKSYGNFVRTPINKGLFESQLVTLANLSKNDIDTLIQRKNVVSEEFGKLVGGYNRFSTGLRSGTGHAESSNARIEELTKLFRKVLDA